MAVVVRLSRIGGKAEPFYRVVVVDSRKAVQSGNTIDEVGSYNPRAKEGGFKVNMTKIDAWLKKGARPSETVAKLIKIAKAAAPAKA